MLKIETQCRYEIEWFDMDRRICSGFFRVPVTWSCYSIFILSLFVYSERFFYFRINEGKFNIIMRKLILVLNQQNNWYKIDEDTKSSTFISTEQKRTEQNQTSMTRYWRANIFAHKLISLIRIRLDLNVLSSILLLCLWFLCVENEPSPFAVQPEQILSKTFHFFVECKFNVPQKLKKHSKSTHTHTSDALHT